MFWFGMFTTVFIALPGEKPPLLFILLLVAWEVGYTVFCISFTNAVIKEEKER
jgi:hypothetical protein